MFDDPVTDTDPRAMEVFIACHRGMTPEQKVAAVLNLSEMIMGLQKSDIRRLYPQASEQEIFLRMAARHLDRLTMIRAYGWDPHAHDRTEPRL